MSLVGLKGINGMELIMSVNSIGLVKTANKYGIAASSLCRWLQANRYIRVIKYIKDGSALPTT